MDNTANKVPAAPDERNNRPIVERPDWFFGLVYPGGSKMPQVKRYIEQLEHGLSVTEKALSDAHTRLEALYEKYGPNCEDCLEFSPGHDGPDPAGDDCWGVDIEALDDDKEVIKETVFEDTRKADDCPYFKPGRLH